MGDRRCAECNKPVEDPAHPLCSACFRKRRGPQGDAKPRTGLPPSYLSDGYFTEAGHLRDELIIEHASAVAQSFKSHEVTTGQIRRFYGHLRQAERRLASGEPFEAVKPALLEMRPLVADAVGRAKAENKDMSVLKDFIDRNVELAAKSQKAMQEGFVPHFMYVVAYFKFFNPKDGKG